ncbi:hypothetical protein COO60DRAFT_1633369 [Scenedesmus sp. NREL 46B-D3]|nr:hypothetical protein COO60DRAFT_1633369 [Scenedesmus sp. NREL 46B-D3]
MGISEQQAELFVQRAFGWGAKARSYWRQEKSEQPADVVQLDAALDFLRQLGSGMSEDEVSRVVKAFPEVLGCDVQQQLQGNVDKLQKDWNLQDRVLVKAVLRQPAVLGYNLDCMGDCAGECNRCWVRF